MRTATALVLATAGAMRAAPSSSVKRIGLGISVLCVSASVAVLAVAGSAPAGPPGKWTRVTVPGSHIDEIGLARDAGNPGLPLLHVVWPKVIQPAQTTEIWETLISNEGAIKGSRLISGKWNAAGGPKLIRSQQGVVGMRLFFAGLGGSSANGGIQSTRFDYDSRTWSAEPRHVSTDVNAAGTVGATFLNNFEQTPIFAWASGARLFVKTGLDPSTGQQEIGPGPSCCYAWPELANGPGADVVTLAYGSIVHGKGGLFVRQVKPTLGAPKLVPKSRTGTNYVLPDQRLPLIRGGTEPNAGVYLAYCGGYPTCNQVLFWKVGGGAPKIVAKSMHALDITAATGYVGRIWVMWWDRDLKRIFAARSNKAVTKFGPLVSTRLPAGASHVWHLYGDGWLGPLDVLASAGNPSAYWHTQLLPPLQASCSRVDKDTVKCVVTDAGDPVFAAHVKYEGQEKITPNTGIVTFTSTKPLSKAIVTLSGYSPTTG